MRRFPVSLMLCLVIASCVFANAKAGLSYTAGHDSNNDGRFTIEIGDQTIWHFGEEGKKATFCLILDGGMGVSFAAYDDEPHVHLDFYLGLLPGVSILFNEAMRLNISAGLRYARIGYAGDINTANSWDKTLSILTLSLMGSHPLRKIDLALDVDLDMEIFTVGIMAGYPALMLIEGHEDGFYASVYGTLDI